MAQARFPVCTALALALLAVACSSAAADCLSQYGPGCTNCVNVTMTTGNRRLQQQVSAQHARAGMSGRGGHGLAPFVRNDTGSSGHHDGVRPTFSAEFLTCTACDSAGYVYKTETRGANTFGHCGKYSPSTYAVYRTAVTCLPAHRPDGPGPTHAMHMLGSHMDLAEAQRHVHAPLPCRVCSRLGGPDHRPQHHRHDRATAPPRQLHLRRLQSDWPGAID